jgi:hypothetical protein
MSLSDSVEYHLIGLGNLRGSQRCLSGLLSSPCLLGCASTAWANSCSNVNVMGTFDESGIRENEYQIYAAGTFRIEGEEDESKQPLFNLAIIDCEKQSDGRASLECKVTEAVLWAHPGKPDTDNPNCSLDLSDSTYSMKELQKGVLTGIAETAACINTMLTIDRKQRFKDLSSARDGKCTFRFSAPVYGFLNIS